MAIRRNHVILACALLAIAAIFLFAFVGVDNGGDNPKKSKDEDLYHLARRFPPKKVLEGDLKTLPDDWPEEGVDVVYAWTRPMSQERMVAFERHFRDAMTDSNVVADNMSGDFAQLQMYFARGVEAFAPWFRRLYVVLPEGVRERPFNESDPRVFYVPHTEIFAKENLPIFNWRAILPAAALNIKNLTKHFVFADDLSFPVSYIAPTLHKTRNGMIRLPVYNQSSPLNTPQGDVEARIIQESTQAVKEAILTHQERLGFKNVASFLDSASIPTFETRGWQFLDKRVITDLFAVAPEKLHATMTHRLRQKDTLDIIQMHHAFIFLMREFYRQPHLVADYFRKVDLDKNNKINVHELGELVKALYLRDTETGDFIAKLFSIPGNEGKSEVEIQSILETPELMEFITNRGVRPQYRYELLSSPAVSIELRHVLPLKIKVVMEALRSGYPKMLWAGPRILGPFGEEARDVIESFLYTILHKHHSTLESVYRPPADLGLWIGIGFFVLFTFGAFLLTKWLLRTPRGGEHLS